MDFYELGGINYTIYWELDSTGKPTSVRWECDECKATENVYGQFADIDAAVGAGKSKANEHHLAKHSQKRR